MQSKPIGLTKSSGFQIGVRRTFSIRVDEAWRLLTSDQGIGIWLGDVSTVIVEKGQRFASNEGISGEITTVNEYQNIRLSWKKENWDKPSGLQIRTIPSGDDKTTISFHQDKLDSAGTREAMREHWEEALHRLRAMI